MPDDLQSVLVSRLRQLWDEPTQNQKIALPNVETFDLPGAGPTIVPHPPQFQPEPTAIGTEAGQALHALMRIAPALQGRVKEVRVGPNPDVMNTFDQSNEYAKKHKSGDIWLDPAEDFRHSNLLGLTNLATKNIGLNPLLYDIKPGGWGDSGSNLTSVLGHELTHAAGYPNEKQPEEVGNLLWHLLEHQKDPIQTILNLVPARKVK